MIKYYIIKDKNKGAVMAELTFEKMQEMQKVIQEKYKAKWGGLSPEKAIEKMLWMHGELAEASDVVKKKGNAQILEEGEARSHFIEEMCDVLMYFNDILICFDIKPEELEAAYIEKYNRNMSKCRW